MPEFWRLLSGKGRNALSVWLAFHLGEPGLCCLEKFIDHSAFAILTITRCSSLQTDVQKIAPGLFECLPIQLGQQVRSEGPRQRH